MTGTEVSVTDFDSEYGLSDLLPISLLEDIGSQLLVETFGVIHPDGTPYYTNKPLPPGWMSIVRTSLASESNDSPKPLTSGTQEISLFPIVHEMEVIGYLAFSSEGRETSGNSIGFLLHKVLSSLTRLRYEGLLTSRLHGEVVEDSYLELQQKVAQLEESERKYRHLAENLEVEVEKKTREIEKAQMQLMLKDKLASLGQLAAGIAHEINNPVGFVKSNLGTLNEYRKDIINLLDLYRPVEEILLERPDASTDQESMRAIQNVRAHEKEIDLSFVREDFEKVILDSIDGVERIGKIVNDLKDFVHLDKAELEWTDINKQIEFALNILSAEIKKKADLVLSLGELPPIRCYPQQINQVFMNILINAVQAIDRHGEMGITTRAEGGWIEIIFTDNGCGIRPDVLPKVFDPFFTTKEVGEGTGLGLNVAYNILKSHKGKISIQSRVGKGTDVIIRLPIKGL